MPSVDMVRVYLYKNEQDAEHRAQILKSDGFYVQQYNTQAVVLDDRDFKDGKLVLRDDVDALVHLVMGFPQKPSEPAIG